MEIKEVFYKEVWPLRKIVIYPEKDIEYVKLPEDKDGLHLGLYVENELISVISLFVSGEELQFRKFATLEDKQGCGYGSKLLNKVLEYAKESGMKEYGVIRESKKQGFIRNLDFMRQKKVM